MRHTEYEEIYQPWEIFRKSWIELDEIDMSPNQNKILNDIILHFKPKQKYIKFIKE